MARTSGGAGSPDRAQASTLQPIPEPHFPDRLHLFIWRNWELAKTDRLAQVLRMVFAPALASRRMTGLFPEMVKLFGESPECGESKGRQGKAFTLSASADVAYLLI